MTRDPTADVTSMADVCHFILIDTTQMLSGEVGDSAHENRAIIQAVHAVELETDLASLLDALEIEFVQRLNMVRCKSNRDDEGLCVAETAQTLYSIGGLLAEPGGWTDLGLPGESVWVGMASEARQSTNYRLHRRRYLCWIRISPVHHTHRKRVSREENGDFATFFRSILTQRLGDILRKSFN